MEGHILPYELAVATLHESVRDTALAYFKKHKIRWWTSRWDTGRPALDRNEAGLPTGHLSSSQVACVNHLEPARLDRELARTIARNVDETFVDAQAVEDGGFVAYEWIGEQNYLGEPGPRVRGANITSLDGLMCAQRSDGMRVLLVIEWKYLESYGPESVATSARGTDRVATYRHLLDDPHCPIKRGAHQRLFFEPYYQLMRQTLLAWQMVEHNEHEATAWLHVHVVPELNEALRGGERGAPELLGETMAEKWRSALKQPERYLLTTPTELLASVGDSGRWSEWRALATGALRDVKDAIAVAQALQAPAVAVPLVLERREALPAAPGFYAWWSRRGAIGGLPHIPHPADDDLSLLYVGISPVRDSSRQTVRSRVIGNHLNGNVGSSTFRFVLAALLTDALRLRPFLRGTKVALDGSDNARLSTWQREHLLLTWSTRERPWEIEGDVIALLGAPLNSAGNVGHEFYVRVRAARAELKQRAAARG